VYSELRVYLDQQMYTVRQNFQRNHFGSIPRSSLIYQLQKAFGDFSHENFTAIFGTPNDVIFAAVHDMVIGLVSQYHWEKVYIFAFSLSIDHYEASIPMPEGRGSTAPFGSTLRTITHSAVQRSQLGWSEMIFTILVAQFELGEAQFLQQLFVPLEGALFLEVGRHTGQRKRARRHLHRPRVILSRCLRPDSF